MRITQDIRDAYPDGVAPDYADEIAQGMAEKSQEFADHGNRVYLPMLE